jgi:hypothetical protein
MCWNTSTNNAANGKKCKASATPDEKTHRPSPRYSTLSLQILSNPSSYSINYFQKIAERFSNTWSKIRHFQVQKLEGMMS